jgi:hypothetical protein
MKSTTAIKETDSILKIGAVLQTAMLGRHNGNKR